MKPEKNSENEVEQTLSSLEGMEKAVPNPFFYTRLKARMATELMQPKQVLLWQVRPIYAFSVVAMVLIMNVITISLVQKSRQAPQKQVYSSYSLTNF